MLLMQPALMQADKDVSVAAQASGQVYHENRNAQMDVNSALQHAKSANKMVLLVMGANWCHDSRDLATWIESPKFRVMLDARYVVVYVDVGTPQKGAGRNLEIARRYGVSKLKSTPLVLILSPDSVRLNSKKEAISWRNAASRSEEDVFAYFAGFTPA
jgi:thioredoxin-related protein